MTTLLNIADWIFIFVLGLPVLYLFVFALFSTRKSMDDYPQAKRRRKFVTLIPAYKSDAVIVRTAQAALRQEYLLRLGAQILHSPARNGLAGARALAESKAAENGWYYMNWLANDNNPEYHRRVTGPAIAKAIAREGRSLVDSVVVSVGSAGTITGVGETLKAWTNDVRMVAVEPFESQALSGGFTGGHGIPEMGFGFIPKNYNAYVVDNVAAVTRSDAARAAQKVLITDAIPASLSAGAALHAAAQLLAKGTSRSALVILSGRQNLNF